jgi:hypothetical protein
MTTRTYACVLIALVLAGSVCACGGGDAKTASAPRPTRDGPTATTYSKDAQLGAGDHAILLSIPQIGNLAVRCGGGNSAAFSGTKGAWVALRAAPKLPTANVVVTTSGGQVADTTLQPNKTFGPALPGKLPYTQTWSVAPYAEGGVRVTTIQVALRKAPAAGGFACAAAAQTTVGAPSGSASG